MPELPEPQIIVVIADTEATGANGVPKKDESDWEQAVAPEGYVINKEKIIREAVSERGSKHTYEELFSDLVEILPGSGIEFPRKIEIRAIAKSEKKPYGGGGHAHYRFTIPFAPISQ
ncbi:hypothetical protein [Bacillus cereus]|uniref:hypothetical protein n=1 Tax=Bacillus cereus TaxID=1396 RepID=UPI0009440BC5|nr:hypothetical protein [Bacillus cereus]